MHDQAGAGNAPPSRNDAGPEERSTDFHVSRWLAGDSEAFQALHDRFAPLLEIRVRQHRIWPALVGRHQVEDVVQEIWARVIPSARKAFTPSGPGSFFAYLGKLADRTLIDLVRSQRAAKRGLGQAEQALRTGAERRAMPRPGFPAKETPTSKARCTELEAMARRELNAREFQAWELVEIQGYSTDEAGLAMRCSGSAVRGLLIRGRSRLLSRFRRKTNG